ncbi:MAG: deoxyribodipyrimidine photo-lyase [Armatimonadetes bacterium]|nr:deoxyribodipyrimidine photo-lyase [Armatimonadota bacterium]
MKTAVCWVRRDLRASDHRALAEATRAARQVAVVFVYDTTILGELNDRADKRVTFIHRSLDDLDLALKGRLLTAIGDPCAVIPKLAHELGAEAVFANHDDDPYALRRDARVKEELAKDGRELRTFKDHVVFERAEVATAGGTPFRVYTPYARAWRAQLSARDVEACVPDLEKVGAPTTQSARAGNHTLSDVGFQEATIWLAPGSTGAKSRLDSFLARIGDYGSLRDDADTDGTSGLSVHLRHGTLSVRECVRACLGAEGEGSSKWLAELIWREFFHMVLSQMPWVVNEPFQPAYHDVDWPGSQEHFERWREGQTGYPLVDAAMRCLNETGWMHNRLRMVVAMFLTKDLLVDYRKGEVHFAEKLLDFELSSNNGGWQWCASTGADAQPWFRIFNPVTQSRRACPKGDFIRRWCPELRDCDDEQVHWPHKSGLFAGQGYVAPIVDHAVQREKALAFHKAVNRR